MNITYRWQSITVEHEARLTRLTKNLTQVAKNPEKLTSLVKAMLVPSLIEAEIKVALGEDEVTTFSFCYALCSSIKSVSHPCIVSN